MLTERSKTAVINGEVATETNISLLFNGELNNDHYDTLLLFERKEKLGYV
jgi:hypothetical protein